MMPPLFTIYTEAPKTTIHKVGLQELLNPMASLIQTGMFYLAVMATNLQQNPVIRISFMLSGSRVIYTVSTKQLEKLFISNHKTDWERLMNVTIGTLRFWSVNTIQSGCILGLNGFGVLRIVETVGLLFHPILAKTKSVLVCP